MGWASFRNKVTGTVQNVAQTGIGLVQTGLNAVTNPFGAIGGLAGMLGGQGGLPQQGMMQGQMVDGTSGYQNNLENLMNMTGQTQVSQSNPTSGGGLI